MDSRAKVAGHAVHPMLIVFPLGCWPPGSAANWSSGSPGSLRSRRLASR